jgi:hypothetical protein
MSRLEKLSVIEDLSATIHSFVTFVFIVSDRLSLNPDARYILKRSDSVQIGSNSVLFSIAAYNYHPHVILLFVSEVIMNTSKNLQKQYCQHQFTWLLVHSQCRAAAM